MTVLTLSWWGSQALAGPFERTGAIAGYASSWGGSYGAAGIGGRVRIEPFRAGGVDLFAEHYLVVTPDGLRHDHPIGFDLYTPVMLSDELRLKPLIGACVVGSFIESDAADAPGADDVLFGTHAGLGVEAPFTDQISAFLDAKVVGWLGHDRSVGGWSGSVSSTLKPFAVAQVGAGMSIHFGRPQAAQ